MHGQVSHELEVGQPATKVWEIYGTLKMAKLVVQKLPNVLEKIEVEGDGGVGTVITATLPEGTPGNRTFKEKVVAIDDDKRVKVVEFVEGGFLDLGFTLYRVTFEVVERESGSSIIRSTIDYEVDEPSKSSLVSTGTLEGFAQMVAEHLAESH